MRKQYLTGLLVAAGALAVGTGLAVAGIGSGGPVVKTPGGEIFKVNKEAGDPRPRH